MLDKQLMILVVDETTAGASLGRKIAEQQQAIYIPCSTPEDAFRRCHEQRLPHLIIIDYRLPKEGFKRFMEHFRNFRGHNLIPVFMWATNMTHVESALARTMGADLSFDKGIPGIEDWIGSNMPRIPLAA